MWTTLESCFHCVETERFQEIYQRRNIPRCASKLEEVEIVVRLKAVLGLDVSTDIKTGHSVGAATKLLFIRQTSNLATLIPRCKTKLATTSANNRFLSRLRRLLAIF